MLPKKTHMLRCAQSPRYDVLPKYAFARQFFARLASEIFLRSLRELIDSVGLNMTLVSALRV
jgi:hypothetical protein